MQSITVPQWTHHIRVETPERIVEGFIPEIIGGDTAALFGAQGAKKQQ